MNSGLHLAHLETLDLSVSEYPQETVYICDFLQRVVANYGDDDDSLAKKGYKYIGKQNGKLFYEIGSSSEFKE